jgi:hypothetical protein
MKRTVPCNLWCQDSVTVVDTFTHTIPDLLGLGKDCVDGLDRGGAEYPPPYDAVMAPTLCVTNMTIDRATGGGYAGSDDGTP